MIGAMSVTDYTPSRQFLCLDFMSPCCQNVKRNKQLGLSENSRSRRELKKLRSLGLNSSFLDALSQWRVPTKMTSSCNARKKNLKFRHVRVVCDLGGQYEDTFADVKAQIINYFTYKATRTVLKQLYEMNPSQYMWFYNFVASNEPNEGKRFLQALVKEKQELAEIVMVTRLHLYGKWIKVCNHAEIYKEISDENLALMRERLIETISWPSDDTNTEKMK